MDVGCGDPSGERGEGATRGNDRLSRWQGSGDDVRSQSLAHICNNAGARSIDR